MDIKQALGVKLSPTARLLLPTDAEFETTGQRWNINFPLKYTAIVDAANEDDVAAAIKYANSNNTPFIAFNGTHGGQLAMREFTDGIGITTLAMKSLELSEDDGGRTAWLSGSWLSGHVRDELFKIGKRTTHGTCDSTGLIGPMLGGGHGLLQGRYGLLADQIVEMRVVLADGSIATVSEHENQDLFWAMRGAGHNFGIVTRVRYKVYDIPKDDEWSYEMKVFKADQLEELVPVFNRLLKEQPVETAMWFPQFVKIPDFDAEHPVIQVKILYNGSIDALNKTFEPLQSVHALATETKTITWPEASKAIDWDFNSFSNMKGLSVYRFPIGVKAFDATAFRHTYEHFAEVINRQPAFGYTFMLWEAYSSQAVKAVPDEATAVADRDDEMLVAVFVIIPPELYEQIGAEAEAWGKELQRRAAGGKELHAYINYAHGHESLEEVYGHEKWRLEKLRGLKKKWDPESRFRFYSPISPP